MYKATVTRLEDPDATKNQKRSVSMILSITNCAIQTGIIPKQWKESIDIMILKKVAVHNIHKLRCIKLLKGDKNFALKHAARTVMREFENCKGDFSEMQYGFKIRKTMFQATLVVVSIMDLAALARTIIATVDTDCKFALDCCIPDFIRIKLLAIGVPKIMTKFPLIFWLK